MSTETILRAARPNDASIGAELLFISGPELMTCGFNRPPKETIQLLKRIWPRGGHTFSYEWVTLAESEAQVVGLISTFTGEELRRASSRSLLALSSAMWPWQVARLLPIYADLSRLNTEIPDDDYYVGNLAVLPSARQHGVGHRLLIFAEEQARQRGCQRCSLDVLIENETAQRVYKSHGYSITETKTNPRATERCGIQGMHHMVKEL